LYPIKLENLEEMDKFVDVFDLLKLNPVNVNYLNRSITNNEIDAVVVFKQRPQKHMDSLPILIKPLNGITKINAPQTIPYNRKQRNAAKLIL
jgi:hypothetical protein